jgi:integrase
MLIQFGSKKINNTAHNATLGAILNSARRGAFQLAVGRAGITDTHFHDLRHTFSARIKNLTDAFTVRYLMGHKDVKTTNIYVEESLADMRKAVDALSSRGRVVQFKTGRLSPGFHRK